MPKLKKMSRLKIITALFVLLFLYGSSLNKQSVEPEGLFLQPHHFQQLAFLKTVISKKSIRDPQEEPDFTENDRKKVGFHITDRERDLSKWLIFSFGFSLAADISPHKFNFSTYPPFNPSIYLNISHGQVVYVRSADLTKFVNNVLPRISDQTEFTLVSGNGVDSIPNELTFETVNSLLNSTSVRMWYAQNLAQRMHPKFKPLPLGNDFHAIYTHPQMFSSQTHHPWEQNLFAERLALAIPFFHRLPVLFVNFRSQSDAERPWGHGQWTSRAAIIDTIQKTLPKTHYIVASGTKPRNDLWRDQLPFAFVASAYGNGLDCHRTWEALQLGQVVIMIRSGHADFWEMFDGLPVILIDSWKNVTAEKLEEWHYEWSIKFSDPVYFSSVREKLHLDYWMKMIRSHF